MTPLPGRFRKRPLFPRSLRITFSGKGFIALTLGVGAAAVNTGNNLLYLAFSMNLSLIILSGILSEGSIRGVRVAIRHASEAFAGRPSFLVLTCSAPGKRFPAVSLAVTPGPPVACGTVRFPVIPPGGSADRVVEWRPSRRGSVPPFSCTISTRFPFGLFEKSRRLMVPASSLLVYPEPESSGATELLRSGELPDGGQTPAGRQGPMVRGAREHMPADPVREIHWKASAKRGRWMVKEREAEPDRVVDIRVPLSSPEEQLERHLSRACGLVLRLEREGRLYRLRIGRGPSVEPSQADRRRRALFFLATAEAESP
ncbi:MAG TPA: hypothetical protein DD658_10690 [Deltaproteobacteria bacterium]|nr:MAG: hypothetical protein A2X88_08245 [Deltaproteobacteria bacterium GWC2_65_14]HBO70544.1 hypothetical protein [Deltaproteobacteria bacterium]